MHTHKKEIENNFTDSVRCMTASWIQSIDKISKIDNKISNDSLTEKFYNTYR